MEKYIRRLDEILPVNLTGFFFTVRIATESLAVFRIGMGLLLIGGSALGLSQFETLFSDSGYLPYSTLSGSDYVSVVSSFPVWEISTADWFVLLVFLLSIISGIGLVIGLKSRAMAVLAFLCVSAIHAKNPFATDYGSIIYHNLLFFMMFLPIGSMWSIDSYLSQEQSPSHYTGFATAGVLIQFLFLYAMNGGHKITNDFTYEGLLLLIEYDMESYTHAVLLNELPNVLLVAMGHAWTWLLFLSPLLFLIPNGHIRSLYTIPYILSHLVMAIFFRIGGFPYVMLCGLVLFIQPITWDLIRTQISKSPINNVSSNSPQEKLNKALHKIQISSSSFTQLLQRSYDRLEYIYHEGIKVSKSSSLHWIPEKQDFVTGLVLFLVLAGNVSMLEINDDSKNPENALEDVVYEMGMIQPSYGFFTTEQSFKDEWYIHIVTTERGDKYDIYNNREPSMKRPYEGVKLHYQFDSHRDHFYDYTTHINTSTMQPMRKARAAYICKNREYNDSKINSVRFVKVVDQYNTSNRLHDSQREKQIVQLGEYTCSTINL